MMMSVERSFEAWEEVQRHGQDIADRLAQGFSGLIQQTTHNINTPSFSWPPITPPHPPKFFEDFPKQSFVVPRKRDLGIVSDYYAGIHGVLGVFDIGKLGQEFGASVNGVVREVFRLLPFKNGESEEGGGGVLVRGGVVDVGRLELGVSAGQGKEEDLGALAKRFRDFGFAESEEGVDGVVVEEEEEVSVVNVKASGNFARPTQGTLNVTSTYDSRRRDVESSLVARGDLWRVEASHGSLMSGNDNSSLFLLQLGPVLFVRDSTLLLPVHLSKQHLLWYGYDRKNGMHSLCPAVWSKHRTWLLMSMICLNPLTCSFMDLQFPNGQFTYVSGEGLSTSAFLPFFGGLLQAQGRYPGEMRCSFSCKNKWGTRITPTVQWPDKSFTLNIDQALAWKRSGLMVRPTLQFSFYPTIGGSNPGVRAELIHSMKEELSLICGCALATQPSAFASLSIGRSKWNGNVGTSGVVVSVETPLGSVGRPSFSVQLNSGIEF